MGRRVLCVLVQAMLAAKYVDPPCEYSVPVA